MKLVEKLGRQYRGMTDTEKRVYQLMMDDVKGFSLKSIGDVAHHLKTSKTTLVRFAKSAGFSGYSDFKKALQEEELLEALPADKVKKIIQNDSSISAENIRQMEVGNVNKTFDALVVKDLAALVDALTSAQCIYTMGWGPSHYIADIFTMRMKLMGLKSQSLKRRDGTLLHEAGQVQPQDALIVFEMPPYVHEVLAAARLAKSTGTKIFLVTDKSQCPVIEQASLTFFCSTDTSLFGNSMTGLLFWVNLVSSQIMLRLKDRVMAKLENQQKIFRDPRYYIQ